MISAARFHRGASTTASDVGDKPPVLLGTESHTVKIRKPMKKNCPMAALFPDFMTFVLFMVNTLKGTAA